MSDQIAYLEKLLEGYKARFKNGEQDLIGQIRVTAAKLDELKLKESYESKKPIPFRVTSTLARRPRGCCGGR